jgi:hypothetical protein
VRPERRAPALGANRRRPFHRTRKRENIGAPKVIVGIPSLPVEKIVYALPD